MEQEFRQTEIEKIPRGWALARLEEITLDLIGGGTPSTSRPEYWDGDIPWMTSANLTNRIVLWGMKNITEKGLRNSATNIVPKGSLLISTRVGIGKVGIAGIDVAISQDLTGLIPDKSKVDIEYLYWTILNKSSHLSGLSQGSTVKGLIRDYVRTLRIHLPPIPEQKKIAEVLSTVDQAIGKVDEAIEKTQRLKKGLMQELLTKGIGHKEFKDTEIGRIPKEWEVVKLGEIIKYEKGRKPKILFDQEEKNTIPYLSAETLRTGTFIQWATENRELIKVNNDDVILIWDGYYCGDSFIGFDGLLSSTMIKIEPKNPNLNKRFLFYFLKACFKELNTKISGMYLKHVNKFILESQTLPLPPLHEQQKIAEILSTVDERLELLRNRKERLKRTKKGLMDVLLTGRKRVRLEV